MIGLSRLLLACGIQLRRHQYRVFVVDDGHGVAGSERKLLI